MLSSSRARSSSVFHPSTASPTGWSRTLACLAAVVAIVVAGLAYANDGVVVFPTGYLTAVLAGWWIVGQFLTAGFAFCRFYMNGRIGYAILGAAFLLAASLGLSYVLSYPGVVPVRAESLRDLQVSPWLWAIRSGGLAIAAIVWCVVEPTNRRRAERARFAPVLTAAILIPILLGVGATAAVVAARDVLPILVLPHVFTPLERHVVSPILAGLCLCAAILFVVRRRLGTDLDLWLAVAFAISALGSALAGRADSRTSQAFAGTRYEAYFAVAILLIETAIEVVTSVRHLANLSRIDPLTDLRNRRAFADELTLGFESTAQRRGSVAIMLVDIDHFKDFNDRYGHARGDACLSTVAKLLVGSLRWPHLLGRYGGEEFVVALWDAEPEAAIYAAERVREAVAAARIEHKASARGVLTISIGVAHGDAATSDPTSLLDSADRALYAAKLAGRNTVVRLPDVTTRDPLAQRFH
jgi:diguanylate cyclase (GGDEF)-like protein